MHTSRLAGIDVARGLALVGMFIAHAAPRPDDSEWLVDGRSSLLFATLAGLSLGLASGGATPTPSRGQMRASVVVRAALLFALGIFLWSIPTDIAIILDYYGIMFLLLAPLLFLRRTALAIIAALLLVVAPVLAGIAAPLALAASTPWPIALPLDRLLTGYYPAVVWLPLLIVGLLAARSDLTRPRTQYAMVIGGVVAMAIGYGSAALVPGVQADAHSSTHAELLGSGGFAFTVTGLLLIATSPRLRGVARAATRVLGPIGTMGAMPLTVYTVQIFVLCGFFIAAGGPVDYDDWRLVAALIAGGAVFSVFWSRVAGSGPLERAFRWLSNPPDQRAAHT